MTAVKKPSIIFYTKINEGRIAAKGHELVSKKHSYINRVKYILDVIGKIS